jgi:hypothetical protein
LLPVATRRQAFRRPHLATSPHRNSVSLRNDCVRPRHSATPPTTAALSQWYLSLSSLPLFPLAAPHRSLFFAAGCTHNSLLSTRLRFTLHLRLLSALLHSPLRSLSAYSPLYFTLRSGTLYFAAGCTHNSLLSTRFRFTLHFRLLSTLLHSPLRSLSTPRHSPLLRPRTTRLSYNAPR